MFLPRTSWWAGAIDERNGVSALWAGVDGLLERFSRAHAERPLVSRWWLARCIEAGVGSDNDSCFVFEGDLQVMLLCW